MKTEMVVRLEKVGAEVRYPHTPAVQRWSQFKRENDAIPFGHSTLLLHGPNGEVGGLEAWMVEWVRNRSFDDIPPEVWALFQSEQMTDTGIEDELDEMVATAIANILNPEKSDE